MRFLVYLYQLLAVFLCVLATPTGNTGLQLTKDGCPSGKVFTHYSSIVDYTDSHDALADKLPGLAHAAYLEMLKKFVDDKIVRDDKPKAITALLVGQTVYYSSSLRGAHPFKTDEHYDSTKVSGLVMSAIQACQADGEVDHDNKLQCGEPLAIQNVLVTSSHTPDSTWKIVTWGGYTKSQWKDGVKVPKTNKKYVGVKPPCGDNKGPNQSNEWGCNQFMAQLHIDAIGDQDEVYAVATGKVKTIKHHNFWDMSQRS